MKHVRSLSLALAVTTVACSSGSEPAADGEPELAAVRARFERPDGTLTAANVAAVLDQGALGGSAASDFDFSRAGSTATRTQGVRPLFTPPGGNSFPFSCGAFANGQTSGSCTCPDGGRFDYTFAGVVDQGDGAIAKMVFDDCAFGASIVDGRQFISSMVDDADPKNPKFTVLMLLDLTVTEGGKTKKLDVQASFGSEGMMVAVKVDDGHVIVVRGKDGTLRIRTKDGEFTCISEDGHGTCTNGKGMTQSF